jgi:hypothetical protein
MVCRQVAPSAIQTRLYPVSRNFVRISIPRERPKHAKPPVTLIAYRFKLLRNREVKALRTEFKKGRRTPPAENVFPTVAQPVSIVSSPNRPGQVLPPNHGHPHRIEKRRIHHGYVDIGFTVEWREVVIRVQAESCSGGTDQEDFSGSNSDPEFLRDVFTKPIQLSISREEKWAARQKLALKERR